MPDARTPLQHAHSLIAQGREGEAAAPVAEALRRAPADHEANCLMCFLLTKRGEHDQAIAHIRRALEAVPNEPNYLANLGKLQMLTGRTDDAVATLRRALELAPSNLNARVDLAAALESRHRYAQAADECRRGLEFQVEHPALVTTLATCLLNLARADRAVARLRRGAAANPTDLHVASSLAGAMNYLPGAPEPEVLRAHRNVGRLLERFGPPAMPPPQGVRDPARPLRVGLVSPDFRAHPVAAFALPILAGLDRGRFHTTCYMTSSRADATTARLRTLAGAWRDVAFVSEPDLAQLIRADAIDILIDLAGHTRGQRLLTFHLRPAPVQITYCGYPNTTGLAAMDLRIVDSLTDPPCHRSPGRPDFDATPTESLIRLDPCFLCYSPPADAPAVAPAPFQATGRITFGSFNSLQKLNDRVIDAWSSLLSQVSGSRLILKSAALSDPDVQREIADRFAARAVAADRLDLLGWAATDAEHLGAYARVDVALDTFPYAGTTTTCESLLMGVPVVTLAGSTHAGRVGVSLLTSAGDNRLHGLIASTEDQYIAIARSLAADRPRLAALRASLRPALLGSALCDQRSFAARFGDTLRAAWREWCAGALDRPAPAPSPPEPPAAPTGPRSGLTPVSPDAAAALRESLSHVAAGRPDLAKSVLTRAAQRFPRDAALADALASSLLELGEPAQALYHAQRGLKTAPDDPGLLLRQAHALMLTQQSPLAIAVFERIVALAPEWPDPRAGLANLYMASAVRFASAAAVCRAGLETSPHHPDLTLQYATALLSMGRAEEASQTLRDAMELHPGVPGLLQQYAFTLNYDPAATPRDLLEAHVAHGAVLQRQMAPHRLPPPSPPTDPDRPLRLGIMSPDLRAHAVAAFFEPIAANLDRAAFELSCYFTGTTEDRVSRRLKALSHRWRHEINPDQVRLAQRIRADGIDILIELSGLTALHRLPVLALRPAPVQVSYIGYPNTTGISTIDERIVDSITDPPGAEEFTVERLARLDGCFLCYAPPDDAPAPSARPPVESDAHRRITFGSLGSLQKINRRVVGVWARLLREVPGSRLLIKNHGLTEPEVAGALAARFAPIGIDADRLLLLPPTSGLRDHLATYDRIDISLDTFPYAGTTTTCESLLMGVPVVSLAGPPPPRGSHAGRVGASLLTAAGLPELIAPGEEEYIALARALATDVPRLASYRSSLRDRTLASPLCDGPAFTRRFEALLRALWRAHVSSR